MLGKLEVLSLSANLEAIAKGVDEQDFSKIKSKAHLLKGAAGYVGATNLYFCCNYIQLKYQDGEH